MYDGYIQPITSLYKWRKRKIKNKATTQLILWLTKYVIHLSICGSHKLLSGLQRDKKRETAKNRFGRKLGWLVENLFAENRILGKYLKYQRNKQERALSFARPCKVCAKVYLYSQWHLTRIHLPYPSFISLEMISAWNICKMIFPCTLYMNILSFSVHHPNYVCLVLLNVWPMEMGFRSLLKWKRCKIPMFWSWVPARAMPWSENISGLALLNARLLLALGQQSLWSKPHEMSDGNDEWMQQLQYLSTWLFHSFRIAHSKPFSTRVDHLKWTCKCKYILHYRKK